MRQGDTLTYFVRSLGRSPSTISREIARNESSLTLYEAAQQGGKQAGKRLRAPQISSSYCA